MLAANLEHDVDDDHVDDDADAAEGDDQSKRTREGLADGEHGAPWSRGADGRAGDYRVA